MVLSFVPDTVQMDALEESTENVTGLPDAPPVADRVSEPPTRPETGAVKEMVWGSRETNVGSLTVGAAAYMAFPAWTASMMQKPGPVYVTVLSFGPETLQTSVPLELST